jgi:exonuclease VII small subunit
MMTSGAYRGAAFEPYSPKCVEGFFSEVGLPLNGVLRSWRGASERGVSSSLLGKRRTRRPMKSKEAHPVTEGTPPTNNGVPDETPARQDVDVLLDVSELEVDRINLTVRGLRAHVSVLAELAGLVNLQVGVDARLDEVELEIEGVRAKVLLKVRLDEVRAILNHALNTLAEHPEILRALTRALNELMEGLVGSALGTLENVLSSLEVGETVDELLKGRLEDARDTLQEVLDQAGDQEQEGVVGGSGGGGPQAGTLPSSAGEPPPPPETTPEEDQ